jgi:hypothetical protein
MTMQQNYQWKRTIAARPRDIGFDLAAGARIKEANRLLALQNFQPRIRNYRRRVASKHEQQAA